MGFQVLFGIWGRIHGVEQHSRKEIKEWCLVGVGKRGSSLDGCGILHIFLGYGFSVVVNVGHCAEVELDRDGCRELFSACDGLTGWV